MRCHIQGQGFGNKMYISELFKVVGYLHTAGFKNRIGINFAKCRDQSYKSQSAFTESLFITQFDYNQSLYNCMN